VTPLGRLSGVHFAYEPERPVLRGADLDIAHGARLAVLGPNGGGKTTAFRLLTGLLTPDAGTVEVLGTPVSRSRRALLELRRRVQLVLQDPDDQLFAATVAQDVSFGPTNLGLPRVEVRERVDAALSALGVADLAGRPPHLLSSGQKKRVTIAGAVAMRPDLLVLDEPTAGLDPAAVEATLATLDELHAAGTTIVLSTHDVDLAHRWADEVAILAGGVFRTGVPDELLVDEELLAAAHLGPAWAPAVRALLRRHGLEHLEPASPADALRAARAGTGRS